MTQVSPPQQIIFSKAFGRKWVLGNALSHGIGMSLPILWTDWLSHTVSIQNYVGSAFISFSTFGLWVGLAQWLMLRQVIPLSGHWILLVGFAPPIIGILPINLFSVSPLTWPLIVIAYILGLMLSQWNYLRRTFQPVWIWGLTSCIAVILSILVGLLLGILTYPAFKPHMGISVLLGGLAYGVTYGQITYMGLRRLTRINDAGSSPQTQSGLDTPPEEHQSWTAKMLPVLISIMIWAVWILLVIPRPSATVLEQVDRMPFWLEAFAILVSWYGYNFLSISIHELGHFICAASQGYQLKAFVVARWGIVRHGREWNFFKTRRAFAGGFVYPIPQSLKVLSRRSLMIMFWGGPIASFLLFFVSALPLFFPSLVNNYVALWWLVLLAGISLSMTVFNILPLALGYVRTDGRRLLDLAQNNLQGQRVLATYGYQASLRQGIRPRDTALKLTKQGLAIPEQSSDHISGLLMAYEVALDKGEIEKAGGYLDEALDAHLYYPEIFRGMLFLEGSYFEAHLRHRTLVARKWFDKIDEPALIPPTSLLRAEAALLLAEGDCDAAKVLAEKGLAKVESDSFMKGSAIVEEERLRAIILAIEAI